MSLSRVWKLFSKEFTLGPRRPFFLWAVMVPIAFTLIIQVAFGALFEPKPRLGIVDEGESAITRAFMDMEGIRLTLLEDAAELKLQVENNDLDAGLVLPSGIDQAIRTGQRPELEFYIGGQSTAPDRIMISVTAIDLVREVEGLEPIVEIESVPLGREGLPLSLRLVPVIVFYALVMAGIWVPASSLVEEKERGTLTALLVTPVRFSEVLLAKWTLGFIFTLFIAAATLLLNRAFGPRPLDVLVVLAVAAALNAVIGVLVGLYSRTSVMMFTLIKGAGIFLFAPVIFYIFPEWHQWIAKIFPLYWVIEPIWQVSILGAPLREVTLELAVAAALTLALVLAVLKLSTESRGRSY